MVFSMKMVFLEQKCTYQFSKWQMVDHFAFGNKNNGDMQVPLFSRQGNIIQTHGGPNSKMSCPFNE